MEHRFETHLGVGGAAMGAREAAQRSFAFALEVLDRREDVGCGRRRFCASFLAIASDRDVTIAQYGARSKTNERRKASKSTF
jgi:hypothetical protein